MKRERDPTPEEFEMFLTWLDSDRDEAACKYNTIKIRLVQLFVSRGCIDAEALGDEVLNRVMVRVLEVREKYSDPLRCCVGFVEFVYQEYRRDELKQQKTNPPPEPPDKEELERREREDECLTQCLGELPQRDRDLVVRYFQGEKRVKISGRQKLAAEWTLTSNALRIKAHRLRKRVLLCLNTCLEQT